MRWGLGLVAWIVVCGAGSEAGAGDDAGATARDEPVLGPTDASPDRWAAAQHELDLAGEASHAGDLPAAHRHLEAAYAFFPDARLLYNLAQIERGLNRPVDALKHYEQFLHEIVKDDPSADKRIALSKEYLTELRRFGEIEVVTSSPVEVIVDDKPAATEPIVVLVGKHVVKIRIGGEETSHELNVQPGQRARIEPSNYPKIVKLTPTNGDSPPTIVAQPQESSAERRVRRPLYRRWQFWTTVAGVIAAVGATIFISRALRSPDCPPDVDCRHFPGS